MEHAFFLQSRVHKAFVLNSCLGNTTTQDLGTITTQIAGDMGTVPVVNKGEIFNTTTLTFTVYPGSKVLMYSTFYRGLYVDDVINITTSLGTWQHDFSNGCSGSIHPLASPIDVTNLFLTGTETSPKNVTAKLTFRDLCGNVEGFQNIYLKQENVTVTQCN